MADETDGFYDSSNGLMQMVKTFYAKNGVENLLYRNDTFLKKIKKNRVSGKTANFSALYSRGGAVSASYTAAKNIAATTAKAAEFSVTPGQLFSCCSYGNRELLLSKNIGYINVAAAKFWASCESFRKTLAVALYGTGYGEIGNLPSTAPTVDSDKKFSVTLPMSAVMALDIGSVVDFKTALTDAPTSGQSAEVESINGTTVNFKNAPTTLTGGAYICLHGCCVTEGEPLLPVGLAGWIPETVTDTSTSTFFGVNRSVARDRLAGVYLEAESGEAKYKTITRAIMALRRAGSLCDVIVMNDEDYIAMQNEIEDKTNFMKTDGGKGKSKAQVGYDGFGFSVSKNFLENVIDSSHCPKGTAYILDSSTVELWTYSNASKIDDGVGDTGKAEISEDTSAVDKPYQALVDDMLTFTPGVDTVSGPATVVTLNFYGNFVITNPSVNGRVKLA